jgi:putative restriction endonuclease
MAKTSAALSVGNIYSRNRLKEQFEISDSTINNGIFKPKAYNSVWLFVTEQKQGDRTQYFDQLREDTLTFSGQPEGRTDDLIINHKANGMEILLFHRDKKNSYPDYGFRYEGVFDFVSSREQRPTLFTLKRSTGSQAYGAEYEQRHLVSDPELAVSQAQVAHHDSFDPLDVADARERIIGSIVRRRGQREFRNNLLAQYGGQCVITGCRVTALLEAAHISPYKGKQTNVVQNGLLLRTDIHTLFDLRFLCVSPQKMRVHLHPSLITTEYAYLSGVRIREPIESTSRPSIEALKAHSAECAWFSSMSG